VIQRWPWQASPENGSTIPSSGFAKVVNSQWCFLVQDSFFQVHSSQGSLMTSYKHILNSSFTFSKEIFSLLGLHHKTARKYWFDPLLPSWYKDKREQFDHRGDATSSEST